MNPPEVEEPYRLVVESTRSWTSEQWDDLDRALFLFSTETITERSASKWTTHLREFDDGSGELFGQALLYVLGYQPFQTDVLKKHGATDEVEKRLRRMARLYGPTQRQALEWAQTRGLDWSFATILPSLYVGAAGPELRIKLQITRGDGELFEVEGSAQSVVNLVNTVLLAFLNMQLPDEGLAAQLREEDLHRPAQTLANLTARWQRGVEEARRRDAEGG